MMLLILLSFANQVYILDGGSHVEGVKQGIIKAIETRSNKCYPDRQVNLNWQKLSSGLTGIVSVMLLAPEYKGSMGWELANREVTDIVSNLVASTLTKYLQQHPQVADAILSSHFE